MVDITLRKEVLILLVGIEEEKIFEYLSSFITGERYKKTLEKYADAACEIMGEEDEDLHQQMYEIMDQQFQSSKQLREFCRNLASNMYIPASESDQTPEDLLKIPELKEMLGNEEFQSFEEQIHDLVQDNKPFETFKENIIEETIQLATKRGLAEAVLPETQAVIIKNLIPDRHDFIDLHLNVWERGQVILAKYKILLKNEDADDEELEKLVISVYKKLYMEILKNKAQEIYK